MKVLRRVFADRVVATANMPAGETKTQMHPVHPHLETLFASFGRAWIDIANRIEVAAGSHRLNINERHKRRTSGLCPAGSLTAAGSASALAFFLVTVFMYAIGWRVGGADAGRRATMLVVTALSATAAALGGGAGIGWYLRRSKAGQS